MSEHDCPTILRAGRHGAWVDCRCGWTSEPYATPAGASLAWALHVRDSRRITFDGTEREREAARRELAKMPPDLLRAVHAIADRHGVSALDAVTFLVHDAQP